MSAKFYKSPAVIFEEQIPLLAKEITGIPQVISAGGACGLPDVGNAVNLKKCTRLRKAIKEDAAIQASSGLISRLQNQDRPDNRYSGNFAGRQTKWPGLHGYFPYRPETRAKRLHQERSTPAISRFSMILPECALKSYEYGVVSATPSFEIAGPSA